MISRNWKLRALTWVCFLLMVCAWLAAQQNPAPAPAVSNLTPSAKIDLSNTEYRGLSQMERLANQSSVTVDFVDTTHVLFTFNNKKLFKRHPLCPPSHADHLVHAAVFDTLTGKVVKETDWYLHDHARYLWPLGSGHFLLRKLNSLYVIDSSLEEKLLLTAPKDLLWVTVTPDGKQIVMETAGDDPAGKENQSASETNAENSGSKYLMQFLDADSLTVKRTLKLNQIVNLDATSAGFADTLHKGDLWLVRFGPSLTDRQNLARVRSRCVPELVYSSSNSLLIGRCPLAGDEYSVSAFTVTGRRLWRQHWSQHRYYPVVMRSEDGSRFGFSTLQVATTTDSPTTAADGNSSLDIDPNRGLEQVIEIYETASGDPIQAVRTSPVVMSGQNFSLAPDGRRLAVLHESAIELYDLPAMSSDEEAKFTALKADAPGLYMRASKSDSDVQMETTPEENAKVEAAQQAEVETQDKSVVANVADTEVANPAPPTELQAPNTAPSAPTTQTTKTEEPASVPVFKVTTQAVEVDVVVTDAKGHPIKGIPLKDFQIAEDGKPQNVRHFREYNHETAPPPPKPEKRPRNVFSNDTEIPDSAITVILLDLVNTPMQDQEFARAQLIKFLSAKKQDAKFALCTLSSDKSSHLRLIQGFTNDENRLLAAVNRKVQTKTVRWKTSQAATDNAIENINELAQKDSLNSWQALMQGLQAVQAIEQVSDTDMRVQLTLDGLTQLARYLMGLPGRKNVVWLSGSFPFAISTTAGVSDAAIEHHNYADRIRQTTNLFADGHISVYPVDVKGIDAAVSAGGTLNLAPVGQATPLAPGQVSQNGSDSVSPLEAFQQQTMQNLANQGAERDTITQVAQDTGGKAFYSANAIDEAINTAVEQGSNYYTLSYYPSNKSYNGRFRKIKITLPGEKGYHLHYRPGYYAEDPDAPVKDANLYRNVGTAAMQHAAPQSRQILFAAEVVPEGPKKKVDSAKEGKILLASSKKKPTLPGMIEVQHYAIDYAIDSSGVRFIPRDNDIRHCSLGFMIASFDEEGTQLSGVASSWTSDLKADDYKDVVTGGVRIHLEVDVPAEAVSLRLGVDDQMSNHLGTIEIPLPVPPPPDVPLTVKHSLPEIEPD